jgi:phosphomannomutase
MDSRLQDHVHAGLAAAGVPDDRRAAALAALDRWLAAGGEHAAGARALVPAAGSEADEEPDFGPFLDAFAAPLPLRGGVLRALAGSGPGRINALTLRAAAAAHAALLAAAAPAGTVLVGFDARRLPPAGGGSSRALARAACAAYADRGLVPLLAPEEPGRELAEPELAALVRRRGAAGGLWVGAGTAAAGEAGATFFGPDGAPRAFALAGGALADGASAAAPAGPPGAVEALSGSGRDAWHAALACLARAPERRDLHVVFSPLNGVAGAAVGGALSRAGFRVTTVRTQAVQDGDFTAVPFRRPDPRQPAALEAGVALARAVGADLVLAADAAGARLGAAIRDEVRGYRPLAEDEIVALVADHLLSAGRGGRVLASARTTPLLGRIAAAAGASFVPDLAPGFAAVGVALRGAAGPAPSATDGAPFLAVGDAGALTARADVPTADAAAAALLLAERAALEKAGGGTLGDALRRLWRRHGPVATRRRRVGFDAPGGAERATTLLARLRAEPPRRVAGRPVGEVRDGDGGLIVLSLEGDARVVVGPGETAAAVDVDVAVGAAPVAPDADDLVLARSLGEADGQAAGLLEGFVQHALALVDASLPRAAFAVPDVVGVDLVAWFFGEVVPQLEVAAQEILAGSQTAATARAWLAEALEGAGPDARALLRPGLEAHLDGLRAVVGERGRGALELVRALYGV